MTLLFHGDPLPSFVKITHMHASLLPSIEADSDHSSPSSKGREFRMEYFFTASSRKDFTQKNRLFAEWLYTETLQPLILPNETDKIYYAKVEGSTEVYTLGRIGRGNVTFVCEPYARSRKEKRIPLEEGKSAVWVNNEGTVEAFPVIDLTFQKRIYNLVISTPQHWLSFGTAKEVDKEHTPRKRKQVLYDRGTSRMGWTSGIGVDNGIIAGELESTGRSLHTMGRAYGEGTAWHGPAGVKMWDHGITDFTLEATMGFKSRFTRQIGRIEIYLLNKDQVRVGKIALRDARASIHNPVFEARIGRFSKGVYFAHKKLGTHQGNDFYGKVTLTRKGKVWRVELLKLSGKKKGKKWVAKHTTKSLPVPIHGIQIHIGAYGKYRPYSIATLRNIRVWEEHPAKEETPYIPGFERGDHVVIDSTKGTIHKNGLPYYDNLDPESTFLRLPKGKTKILFTPKGVKGVISFRERYR